MDERTKETRRRGEILNDALLDAAWEELSETGYTNMTMESVATRAGTNKSVLYRRWTDKSELVIAAIRKHLPRVTDEIPDTGNLRDDVYWYLRARAEPMRTIGTETLRSLLLEPVVWRMMVTSVQQIIERKSRDRIALALTAILKNAAFRGEVTFEKLTPRVISLPWDLMWSELITKLEPVSDESIAQIVDDIFMPLISQYR